MKRISTAPIFTLATILAAAGVPAFAEEPTVEELATPKSEVNAGLNYQWGTTGGDARFSGQYNGRNEDGAGINLNADIVNRDNQTGTWFKFKGNNLGQENRDARFEHEKQGKWGYFFEYSQTPHTDPVFFRSKLNGINDSKNYNDGVARNIEFETTRYGGKAGVFSKFNDGYEAKFGVKEEIKRGAKQSSAAGSSNTLLISDPQEYETTELDGSLGYADRKMQVQAGYLGSFFKNNLEYLAQPGAHTEISKPMDNQAHQFYFNGGYNFTPTLRGTLRASFTEMLQNEDFYKANTRTGRTDLGGRVDVTSLNAGLSAQPIKGLNTRMKLRYDDRADRTPRYQYIAASAGARDGYNVPFSRTATVADFDADYQLPYAVKAVAGVKMEDISRSNGPAPSVTMRRHTNEMTYKGELRRSLSEDLSGSIGYIRSERTGSRYLFNYNGAQADPIHWGDRIRDKIRTSFDFSPTKNFSTQLQLEGSNDSYDSRPRGPREGHAYFAGLDATYQITRRWSVTGWASIEHNKIDEKMQQQSNSSGIPAQYWSAKLHNIGKSFGLSTRGEITDSLKIGGNIQHTLDTSKFNLSGEGTALSDLPDIKYAQTDLKFFTDYELSKDRGVKFDYVYTHIRTNDWTWSTWNYTGNNSSSTGFINPSEDVHFFGLSYYQRW